MPSRFYDRETSLNSKITSGAGRERSKWFLTCEKRLPIKNPQ